MSTQQLERVKQPRMTGPEILAEVEWLHEGGMSAEEIAEAMGRKPVSLATLAYRHNNDRVRRLFDQLKYPDGWSKR